MQFPRTLLALCCLAAVLAAGGAGAGTTAVRVSAKEFRFSLSRKALDVGTVRFTVVNAGELPHDFAIAGRKTRILEHRGRAVLEVRISRPGRYRFYCTLPGHARLGMAGVLVVGRSTAIRAKSPAPKPGPAPSGGLDVALTPIGRFPGPTFLTAPPGEEHSAFVVEKAGVIEQLVDGKPLPVPFLDISTLVVDEGENGLLSMAFARDYATSGRFYVVFNSRSPNKDL